MTDVVVKGRDGRLMLCRERRNAFSAAKQARFLAALAQCCNVDRAADYAGVHRTTVYQCRARNAEFAARWRDAVEMACDRLELMLLEHAGAALGLDDAGEGEGLTALPQFNFDRGLAVLKYYRGASRSVAGGASGASEKPATREDTMAALAKGLAAARNRRARRAGKRG